MKRSQISSVPHIIDAEHLLGWLERQPSTIGTHSIFREIARSLAISHNDQAALLILLVALSKRFTTFFEDVPITVQTADAAHLKLIELFRLGISANKAPAEEELAMLNRIANSNLLKK